MRRSKERLEEIDSYLREHYPKKGSKACSEALSETIDYTQSRVQLLKLLRDNPKNNKKKASDNSKLFVMAGKITAKNREIENLWELLRKQRAQNKELRTENIRLITEKIKARLENVKESV